LGQCELVPWHVEDVELFFLRGVIVLGLRLLLRLLLFLVFFFGFLVIL
jgi:hypothetical protein